MAALRVLEWMERAPVQARVAAVAPLVRTLFTARLSEEQRDGLDTTLTMLLDAVVSGVGSFLTVNRIINIDPALVLGGE